MSPEKTTLEVIAQTVEEAVSRGLEQLGLPEEAVEVEVLDQGAKGLFGLGNRQARVRLVVRPISLGEKTTAAAPEAVSTPSQASGEDNDYPLELARHVVEELITRMKVNAKVESSWVEQHNGSPEPMVLVDVHGEDLSILIGRRSEVLNSLQYIASLIVSKELGKWVPLMIDIQGYRTRRERQLRQLAQRMAEQAVHSGRRQVLEPMSASERRIIHLELRDHPDVVTESVGDEPNRKVTILLKR
ncbi:MAG TPA: RNA-binding cell elongation regulator Jag/EloR [Anaerolineaceae bacterium]|nr:RNA-binding cell elongation regulator Jag/EloR [Anaerolineaceae bacterium]